METPITVTQEKGRRLRGAALGAVLTALMLTLLLEALDQTIVGTALPRIIGTLQGFDRYIWAVTAYTLASSTLIPVVGKLSDQFGRKWFLIVGALIFLAGSAASGASQTMTQLIAFRAVQGLGAGIGIALVFTVVGDIFPPAERAKWQGIFGAVYGFSSVVGPTLGGWLTDHGPLLGSLVTDTTRWRWVFYINLPIGALAVAALLIYLPANISVRSSRYSGWAAVRRIDFLGAILAAAATISLLLGLTWGSNQIYDWTSVQVIGALAGAGLLYIAFFLTERFVAEPIVPLDLFRNRVFAVASILSLLQLMVLVALVIYLPLFLQGVLGESATNAGAVITPLTLATVVGAGLAGFLVATLKRYQLVSIAGALIMTAGVLLLTRLTPTTSLLEAAIYMAIAGVGLGTFFSVLTLAAQNALPSTRLGVGTGAVRYMGQLGSVLGVAIVGTVVNNSLADELTPRLHAIAGINFIPPVVVKLATNPQVLTNSDYKNGLIQGVLHQVPPQFRTNALHTFAQIFDALKQSLSVSIVHGFVVVLIFSGLTLLFTLLLKDVPLKKTYDEAPAGVPASESGQAEAAPLGR